MSVTQSPFSLDLIRHAAPGTIVYPPGGRFGPRQQTDFQLVLVHTGSMKVDIDGIVHHVQPGYVELLKPGRTETFEFAKEQDTWHRWIAVHINPVPIFTTEYVERLPSSIPITEELNRLTDLMLALSGTHGFAEELMRSLGLAALLLYASDSSADGKEAVHPSVGLAKSIIRSRYGEELTLKQLAGLVGLSPEHLVRLFKRHERTTPIKFLWHYRVLRACEMLMHTGLTIGEIAARCGFKTTYHFARVIKQATGRTPTGIRQAHWNAGQ